MTIDARGYNANAPTNDGSQTENNEIVWDATAGDGRGIKENLTDPIKEEVDAIETTGLPIAPGSDIDVNLITLNVTGTPTFLWDESEDSFSFNKSISTVGIKLLGNVYNHFRVHIINSGGTLQHRIFQPMSSISAPVTATLATAVNGFSSTLANTPQLDSSTGFVSGAGIRAAAQEQFYFDTVAQAADSVGTAIITIFDTGTGDFLKASAFISSQNFNSVTRTRIAVQFSTNDGTLFTIDTTNLASGKSIQIDVFGYFTE